MTMSPRAEAGQMADNLSVRLAHIRGASLRGGLPDLIKDRAEEARRVWEELTGQDGREVVRGEDG